MTDRNLEQFSDGDDLLVGSFEYPDAGDAPPLVVLLTGDGPGGSNGMTWSQLANRLRERGIASFLFDFKGLGHSPGAYEELTLSVGCRNLDAAMDYIRQAGQHDVSRVALLGASYGGNVALLKAAEYPEVRAIALKSPSSFLPEGYELQYGSEAVAAWGEAGYSEEIGLNYTAVLDSLFHNTFAAASRIQVPVRIAHGTADSAVPIRHSRDLVRVMPNGSLFEIPGADHWYAEGDEWAQMATDLVDFLARELAA